MISRTHVAQQAATAHAAGEDTFAYGVLYQPGDELAQSSRQQLSGALEALASRPQDALRALMTEAAVPSRAAASVMSGGRGHQLRWKVAVPVAVARTSLAATAPLAGVGAAGRRRSTVLTTWCGRSQWWRRR